MKTTKSIVAEVRKMLNQRKVVFFSKYPDARKQQLIISANNVLIMLEKQDETVFKNNIKVFADRFILPLVPNKESRFHESGMKLYNNIKSL